MGHDCNVRFANGMGEHSSLDITVSYKTSSTGDEIQTKDIHIDGANYHNLTFNYLESVYSKGKGTAHVRLDTNAFDGQPDAAYFTTRWGYAGDWGHHYLEWASGGKSRDGWQFE